jgi:hypothetical protein
MLRRLVALGSLWLLNGACTEFPSIPDGSCGNGVVDKPEEDCDTFPRGACRPPGAPFECHLDCSPRNGARVECRPGWGCDADFVCREPTGEFAEPSLSVDVGAWSLSTGDFDGDGREDVMSSEPLDAIGATRLRFFYFDKQGVLADTQLFGKSLLSPAIQNISDDRASDVVFTQGALGVMFGRADRKWVPETYSSYRVRNATVRVVGVHDRGVQLTAPFASLISHPTGTGFYLVDPQTGEPTSRVSIPGRIADLVGELVSGNLIEDSLRSPCLEPVLAMRGAKHFSVVNVCDSDDDGAPIWRQQAELSQIALDPPAAIDSAPLIFDLNGDGHLDVLLGAQSRAYVSLGDGSTLAPAVPYLAQDDAGIIPKAAPLAVGDLTGDGAPDFVFPDRLLVSVTDVAGATPRYYPVGNRLSTPWTVAKMADFNRDGSLDVVAASNGSLHLAFFNGTGSQYFTESLVDTDAPVQFLTAGDFDGDRTTDLALFEAPPPGQTKSTLKISFGAAYRPLPTPIAVAHVVQPEALSSYKNAGFDNLTVCASELIDGVDHGALTMLAGGPDHVPFAPFTLTEFSSTRSVQDAGAIAVIAGRFTKENQSDLMALAFFAWPDSTATPAINVWSLPAITAPGSSPKRLPGALDQRLNPLTFSPDHIRYSADVVGTAADLYGDKRDEAIFAMPADGGRHCGLLLIDADRAGELGSAGREPVVIDRPCPDPQIAAVDADHDGHVDLALLTGSVGAADRQLFVFWNDRSGRFSGADTTLVSAGDSPQAFTVLPLGKGKPNLAYITKDALRVVHGPSEREFPSPVDLLPELIVNGGSGITAADVDGDRVTDLVFAESGKLRVLKAGLNVQ